MPSSTLARFVVAFLVIGTAFAASQELSDFPFAASSVWKVSNDNAVPSLVASGTPFIISKDQTSRTSAVVRFDTNMISPHEFFFKGAVEALLLSSESWNQRARIGVIPLGPIDNMTNVMYDTLPRLEVDASVQTLANEAGNKIVLDVVAGLEEGVRAFELIVIGGGNSASLVLNHPHLVLQYPAWSPVPPETGCVRVETPVPNVAAPGIVSIECPTTGSPLNALNFEYIHGAPTSHKLWDDIPQYMQAYGNVLLPNLPGNGVSGDIVDLNGRPWPEVVVEVMVEWNRIRDFNRLIVTGHDFGGPTAVDVAHELVAEGRIEALQLVEAVSTDQITCPADGEGCFTDGSAVSTFPDGSPNTFMPNCFGLNIDNCAKHILEQDWFNSTGIFYDPVVWGYAQNPQIGGQPIFLAYDFYYCYGNVYNLLNTKCRPLSFWDDQYGHGVADAGPIPTQAKQYWPRSLYNHGYPTGQHNIWTKEFNLRARASLENGPLSTIPMKLYTPDFTLNKNIAGGNATRIQWAEDHYANFERVNFGSTMGHFFTEDGFNGAYSFSRAQQTALTLSSA